MKQILVTTLLGIALVLPGAARAQQQEKSATFRVSATVTAVCEVTASDLNFGQYTSQAGSDLTGTTKVAVACTPATAYNVGLSAGTSPGATVNQRKMVAGANSLNYQLYQDSSRTKIWGTTPGTDTLPGTGTGQSVDHTVFGTIPARQVIPAGDYGDTVTVRVYF